MTTELEQEFFNVFGIEKNNNNCPMLDKNNCIFVPSECNYYQYPEITDRKLLKMICILNDYEGINVNGTTIEELKEELLNQCIEYFKYLIAFEENADLCDLHNKIQQLFKEEE